MDDAVFYRDVHYVIYIPDHYGQDVLQGKEPVLDIKSTGDYQASLVEMVLERYLKVQGTLVHFAKDESQLVTWLDQTLRSETSIVVDSEIDLEQQSYMAYYFNFASYAIMACIVFIVCLIMTSFKDEYIKKRTIITPLSYHEYNRQLLLANGVYVFVLWFFYMVVAAVLTGQSLFEWRGAIYGLNFLIYAFCSLTIAMVLSTLIADKNVVSGIANVIALGSAFLSGVFVPASLLPDFVLKIAHVLPSYWFVNTNEMLKTVQLSDGQSLQTIGMNMLVMMGFIAVMIIINNILTKRKQVFG